MSDPVISGKHVSTPASFDANLPFQKHWFCAAICKDGTVVLRDSDSPAEFIDILNDSLLTWVDYRTANFESDVRTGAQQLGFTANLVDTLADNPRLLYEDYDAEMGIKLPSIQIRVNDHVDVQSYPLILLLRSNFILTIHPLLVDRRFTRLRRYSQTILKKIPITASPEDKLTLLLTRIIDQNNDRNFEHLRQIEERGDDLNKSLLDPNVPRATLGPQIYGMKHSLIKYLDALWETIDVLHDLRYGDANLITNEQKLLERIEYLSEDVSRQIGLAEHMSEVLASGLEVLQSIYNNQLQAMNNRMALLMTYFTVLGTAVLVPNTLATVFSNAAFGMETKDAWWYIIMLVVSTVVAILLTVWWVRKSGLIPKKME